MEAVLAIPFAIGAFALLFILARAIVGLGLL